ncbi:MAG: hypothetical protein ABI438_07525 [Dermatophilaceae bacterium]
MSTARVDIVRSRARVDILDADTDQVVDHCYGLTSGGSCPDANQDGIVPCNGRRVAPSGSGPEFWKVWVPPASRHCPMSWNLDSITY